MADLWERFLASLAEAMALRRIKSVLEWDQEVNMPPKGARARAEHLAVVAGLEHRAWTSPALREMIESLQSRESELDPESAAILRETKWEVDRLSRLPEALVRALTEAASAGFSAWVDARRNADFSLFEPYLQRLVSLSREKADCLGWEESPYDALLEEYERGMTHRMIRELFENLAARQAELVAAIVDRQEAAGGYRRPPEGGPWSAGAQRQLTEAVLQDMGYDFQAGRQDLSPHPFTTTFDVGDVRITTRFDENDFLSGLSSSMHEAGHALYEQGMPDAWRRTPLADAPSLGMHESQSRFWENIIGRSRPFCLYLKQRAEGLFQGTFFMPDPETLYRALTCVEPSLIRVEADECTYNLHVVLRFEIEAALLEGTVSVKDVPELWNGRMRAYLGLTPPDDARGCLQDVHWSHGAFGYFPTYALGNLYAAQLCQALRRDLPDLWHRVEQGQFGDILAWLREKIHRCGRTKTAGELLTSVTGMPPSPEPFLHYLKEKFLS